MKRLLLSLLSLASLPVAALGGTLEVGESRTVEGKIAAVDVAHRSVVLEVPTPKGDWTVGVTLEDGVAPQSGGRSLAVDDLSPGAQARLRYVRRDGRLVGLALTVLP